MISVVIPAYNEEKRIGNTISEIDSFLRENFESYEIIVADDGSTDGMREVVSSLALPYVSVVGYLENAGKGKAVSCGVQAAKGNFIVFTDADLSYSPTYIKEAYHLCKEHHAEVILGSREEELSTYPVYRKLASVCFSFVVRSILKMNIPDTQCGFKCFSASAAKRIFHNIRLTGWGFDVELIYIAVKKRKFSVRRLPVAMHHENDGSKIRLFSDSVKMIREVLAVRKNDKLGLYDET